MHSWRRRIYLKKSDCHIHATLKQRLDAVHKLRFQHLLKTLCRALEVNRSTYYKHFCSKPAPRTEENQHIASFILRIYSDHNKRLGTYKICYLLQRDYGIDISVGRVYRLMKKHITYLKAGGKWYYLCIIMDLFS